MNNKIEKSNHKNLEKVISKLSVSIAIFIFISLFSFVYYEDKFVDYPNLYKVIAPIAINIMSAILIFYTLFFYYYKHNLNPHNHQSDNITSKEYLEEQFKLVFDSYDKKSNISNDTFDLKIYKNYRDIPWKEMLENSNTMDIVVYYFDSWIGENWDIIKKFLELEGTINIIMPKPENTELMKNGVIRFPKMKNDISKLQRKIKNTVDRFHSLLDEAQIERSRIKIKYINDLPNYSLIRIDNRIYIHSTFEHNPSSRVNSPSLCYRVKAKDSFIRIFFDKELSFLYSL